MASSASEVSGIGRSLEGISSGQLSRSGELIAEWRSSEQVENGTPSTSPPYWETDDDDCGPKPAELYVKYTWKIDKFSEINQRELRSDPFDVGGYKWYILIYPQGCDVCNHLSLFLCVANHDKLLPGWSHFAQFTIAVVNKDHKKSKYSDTLHRFWKKEHDWGWKKFMELSKVSDGFIDDNTLIIKAQVQVIRERADRPFRCLDCQYRTELVRVYLTNVEQICRRFVEERRGKLEKLIEDKDRWSSFCAFWLGVDQNTRRRMSREKTDAILKVVLKHFFIEKEVTSTLVMDSLYSGLKALEGHTKRKKGGTKLLEAEEMPVPIVRVEKDMFVLVDDVLLLLERAAMEPLPPKDEKGPQNRTKDGGCGEDFNKDSIERDERRLMELGRRTIEIFVLAHIFSKIEVAYHEAVALKRQEELIREEEAAWMAETEQKAKRGVVEKEKKSKKKQGKQKRNNRKGKDKGKDEMSGVAVQDKLQQDDLSDETKDLLIEQAETLLEKPDKLEDVSDASDSVDCVLDILQPDSEDRDASPVSWDTDASEVQPPIEASSNGISSISSVHNGMRERQSPSLIDDSSSTCSTDSVPSVVTNGLYNGNSIRHQKSQKSPSREMSDRVKVTCDATSLVNETHSQPSKSSKEVGLPSDVSESCKVAESESGSVVLSLQDRKKWLERHVVKKEEEVFSLQRELSIKDRADIEKSSTNGRRVALPTSPRSTPEKLPSAVQLRSELKINPPVLVGKQFSSSPSQTDKAALLIHSAENALSLKPDTREAETSKPTEKLPAPQIPVMSRSLNTRLIPAPRPTAPVVSVVQTTPSLSHSVSAGGRLGPELSAATHSYIPQSYRSAIMGNPVAASTVALTQAPSPSMAASPSQSYSQPLNLVSTPMFLPQSSERTNLNTIRPSFSVGIANHEASQNGFQWVECHQPDTSRSIYSDHSSPLNDVQNYDLYKPVQSASLNHFPTDFPACSSGRQRQGVVADDFPHLDNINDLRQSQGLVADEFPHLDIINDLLDDEHGIGKVDRPSSGFRSFSNGPRHLNRQYTLPGDIGFSSDMAPSTRSCRFERTRSYHDEGFQRGYGSSGGYFDSMREMITQPNQRPYVNGQVGELIPNQWQMAASDLSSLSLRHNEGDNSAYHIPEYSNLAYPVNGYTVFQPPNGH
ncbi:TNF receptor-associated factor homolog 1a-like isoform X2 [Cornus florida]|uniref:TNF receptor-associated factor homolog 1a-like isoform X2 n=1 Tax=Cornus florida TaxID=4283 RepID=UPI00289EFEC8|nr:TNF receptor-associated factor homolog 1a-like isoform X2 [Cornus florida]